MFHSVKANINKGHSKSKSPIKPEKVLQYQTNSSPRKKREAPKTDQSIVEKESKNMPTIKSKTKQTFLILQNLEEIHSELTFDKFDIFPIALIDSAKKNIEDLMLYLGQQPTCRYHKDLLNLYCDHDKSVICVSCVYKSPEHRSHKIKSIESVEKVIELETLRCEQKNKALIHQLSNLKDEIEYMTKQIGQNYKNISNYTISIVDQSIRELNDMKTKMEKKISLAYRRTMTVINRYNQSLQMMINRLEKGVQQSMLMSPLSKHLLLKQFTMENDLIENLVNKFSQNKEMMTQWHKSNGYFEKIVLKMRNTIAQKIDSFVVTQF